MRFAHTAYVRTTYEPHVQAENGCLAHHVPFLDEVDSDDAVVHCATCTVTQHIDPQRLDGVRIETQL